MRDDKMQKYLNSVMRIFFSGEYYTQRARDILSKKIEVLELNPADAQTAEQQMVNTLLKNLDFLKTLMQDGSLSDLAIEEYEEFCEDSGISEEVKQKLLDNYDIVIGYLCTNPVSASDNVQIQNGTELPQTISPSSSLPCIPENYVIDLSFPCFFDSLSLAADKFYDAISHLSSAKEITDGNLVSLYTSMLHAPLLILDNERKRLKIYEMNYDSFTSHFTPLLKEVEVFEKEVAALKLDINRQIRQEARSKSSTSMTMASGSLGFMAGIAALGAVGKIFKTASNAISNYTYASEADKMILENARPHLEEFFNRMMEQLPDLYDLLHERSGGHSFRDLSRDRETVQTVIDNVADEALPANEKKGIVVEQLSKYPFSLKGWILLATLSEGLDDGLETIDYAIMYDPNHKKEYEKLRTALENQYKPIEYGAFIRFMENCDDSQALEIKSMLELMPKFISESAYNDAYEIRCKILNILNQTESKPQEAGEYLDILCGRALSPVNDSGIIWALARNLRSFSKNYDFDEQLIGHLNEVINDVVAPLTKDDIHFLTKDSKSLNEQERVFCYKLFKDLNSDTVVDPLPLIESVKRINSKLKSSYLALQLLFLYKHAGDKGALADFATEFFSNSKNLAMAHKLAGTEWLNKDNQVFLSKCIEFFSMAFIKELSNQVDKNNDEVEAELEEEQEDDEEDNEDDEDEDDEDEDDEDEDDEDEDDEDEDDEDDEDEGDEDEDDEDEDDEELRTQLYVKSRLFGRIVLGVPYFLYGTESHEEEQFTNYEVILLEYFCADEIVSKIDRRNLAATWAASQLDALQKCGARIGIEIPGIVFDYSDYTVCLRQAFEKITVNSVQEIIGLISNFFVVLENQAQEPMKALKTLEIMKAAIPEVMEVHLKICEVNLRHKLGQDVNKQILDIMSLGLDYASMASCWPHIEFINSYKTAIITYVTQNKEGMSEEVHVFTKSIFANPPSAVICVEHNCEDRLEDKVENLNQIYRESNPATLKISLSDVIGYYYTDKFNLLFLFDSLYYSDTKIVTRYSYMDLQRIESSGLINTYIKLTLNDESKVELKVDRTFPAPKLTDFLDRIASLWRKFRKSSTDEMVQKSTVLAHALVSANMISHPYYEIGNFTHEERQELLTSLHRAPTSKISAASAADGASQKQQSDMTDSSAFTLNPAKYVSDKNQSIFFAHSMNTEKLDNMLNALSPEHQEIAYKSSILCLFDETVTGISDRGVLITPTHLFYKIDLLSSSSTMIPLAGISNVTISGFLNKKISINHKYGKSEFVLTQGNKGAEKIVELLTELIKNDVNQD